MYNKIELSNSGENESIVELGDVLITLHTRYNYSAQSWTMDIYDATNTLLAAGLMLVPNVDVLHTYTALKALIGALVLVELNKEDYHSTETFGTHTALLWYPPGVEVELYAS